MSEEVVDSYDIITFCQRNSVCRATLYNLWRRGEGPRWMQVGSRRLISREAATEWRREMEQRGGGLKAECASAGGHTA